MNDFFETARFAELIKKSTIPSMINDPCVYPECWRPKNTIFFMFKDDFESTSASLITKDSIFNPEIVSPTIKVWSPIFGFVLLAKFR